MTKKGDKKLFTLHVEVCCSFFRDCRRRLGVKIDRPELSKRKQSCPSSPPPHPHMFLTHLNHWVGEANRRQMWRARSNKNFPVQIQSAFLLALFLVWKFKNFYFENSISRVETEWGGCGGDVMWRCGEGKIEIASLKVKEQFPFDKDFWAKVDTALLWLLVTILMKELGLKLELKLYS